ncbi:MAG: hypothetical protein E7323_09320 [Clostridiales bacterium]|nr:hypothetical protein [Clostridiales bacterium]
MQKYVILGIAEVESLFQRDYILRMIEMMGDLARKVAQLMEELEYLHQLDDASRLHCGMPLKALEDLSHESLLEMMAPEPRLYASELLHLRAMERSVQWDYRDRLLLKSLRLLASLTEESVLCEIRAPRLRELKAAVLPMMTTQDFFQCACFFNEGDCYDEMEDALFQGTEAAQDEANRKWIVEEGCHLLREASHNATDTALAYCRMTREELNQAAQELRAAR